MRLLLLLIFTFYISSASAEYLFVESKFSPNKKWTKFSNQEKLNIKNLFQMLVKSKTGKELVRRANKKCRENGKTLYDVVKKGNGSLTDTTLVRKFNVGTLDDITYETQSKVFINKELNQYDALLDLAHELTHYVYRKNFNPYQANFSLGEFITNTIEGVGGEVQAFMMECRIHSELFTSKYSSRFNCKKIEDPKTGVPSFKRAVKRFYQVGGYYESFNDVLKSHGIQEFFPDVTSEKVSFVSSAYGIPYPVAAFEEYLSVLGKVCENDKRRISYFKNEKSRSPASISKLENSYESRCKNTL